MTDDDDDLFAVRPAKLTRRPAKRAEPLSETYELPAGPMLRQPSGLVASFSCICGAQDEVREPAPATVKCWSCKPARDMKRWPSHDTPVVSARVASAEERARL